eukprot:gene4139-4463_t
MSAMSTSRMAIALIAATLDRPAVAVRFVAHSYSQPTPPGEGLERNVLTMASVSAEGYTGHFSKGKWVPPDPGTATSRLVNATSAAPRGRAAIRAWDLYHNASQHPQDNILSAGVNCSGKWPDLATWSGMWWDHGAAEVAALHGKVLGLYKAAGGRLDLWAVDDESASSMHSWWIAKNPSAMCGRAKYTAVENDPRFPALLALLKALGFGNTDTSSPY